MNIEDNITRVTVQIINEEGGVSGAGILLNEAYILTCAHVIAPGFKEVSPTDAYEIKIRINIPSVQLDCKASIVYWDEEKDIAGLELPESLSESKKEELFSQPLLTKLSTLRGRQVNVFGFPRRKDNPNGIWSAGVVRGQQTGSLMQLDPTGDTANLVEGGFSGGPVVDVSLEKIVGMLTSYDSKSRAAYFLPMAVVESAWTELSGLVAEPQSVISPFAITSTEIEKIESTFVSTNIYTKIQDLKNKNTIWLKGPSGIGKKTCAIKIAKDSGKPIYVFQNTENWKIFSGLELQQVALIFPDCLGKRHFTRDTFEEEWKYIEGFADPKKENLLIFTIEEKVFDEVNKQIRFQSWNSQNFIAMDERMYSSKSKDKSKKPLFAIFLKLLNYADEKKKISSEQVAWGQALVNDSNPSDINSEGLKDVQIMFQKQMDDSWVPSDIERFINHLSSVSSPSELREVLRQEAELESQVHLWFSAQSNSHRVFLLALSLLAGSSSEDFWSKYCQIVRSLKDFDPSLAILPLGILRQQTFPYVSAIGDLDFVSDRALHLVRREVARFYREYLMELTKTFLKDWSQADASETAQMSIILQGEKVRIGIAETIGESLIYGNEDILVDLIRSWAKNYWRQVSASAAIALQRASSEKECASTVFKIIDQWISDQSDADDSYRCRWTASTSLWRIGQTNPDHIDMIIQRLNRLAQDRHYHVLEGVAIAVRNLVSVFPVQQLLPILSRLARIKIDKGTFKIRRQLTFGLSNLSLQNENRNDVFRLLESWANSKSTNAQWTAVFVLLFGKDFPYEDRFQLFAKIHKQNPSLVFKVLTLTLEKDNSRSSALDALKVFWKYEKQESLFTSSLEYINSKDLQDFVDVINKIAKVELGIESLSEETKITLENFSTHIEIFMQEKAEAARKEWENDFEKDPLHFLEKLNQLCDEDKEFVEKVLISIPDTFYYEMSSQLAEQSIDATDPSFINLSISLAGKSNRFKMFTNNFAKNILNMMNVDGFLSVPVGLTRLHPTIAYQALVITYAFDAQRVKTIVDALTQEFWAGIFRKKAFVKLIRQAVQYEKSNGRLPDINFIPEPIRSEIQ